MKKAKKILCLILTFISILSISSTAFAQSENIGLTTNPSYIHVEGISTYSIYKPDDVWNLAKKGKYYFEGWCNGDCLYTNYKFTGKQIMKICVTNLRKDTSVTVKLLKEQFGIDWSAKTYKVKANDTESWTAEGLDASAYYYLQFSQFSRIEGYIY